MKYGLYMPIWFEKQNFENYYGIPFSKSEYVDEYFVDINFFRNLYQDRVSIFNNIVIELILRGGTFILEKESKLFPNIIFPKNLKLIRVKDNMPIDSYKKINFRVFHINNIYQYFDIKDNMFFEFLPIYGFKALGLSDEDLIILEKDLKKNGFDFIEI